VGAAAPYVPMHHVPWTHIQGAGALPFSKGYLSAMRSRGQIGSSGDERKNKIQSKILDAQNKKK
jgi:hypothetical protein